MTTLTIIVGWVTRYPPVRVLAIAKTVVGNELPTLRVYVVEGPSRRETCLPPRGAL